ncbi:MAG: alpha/beta fold hydrolase [Solirubrobacterales bacterium]
MARLAARGAELEVSVEGAGTPLLCLHETGTGAAAWRPLAAALGDRWQLIAPDRRGWAGSLPPPDYRATTVEEQAEDAVAVLESLNAAPALLCGAGLGAVAALDLLIGRPELALGAVLIEPPLLAFSAAATERLSADRVALSAAVQEGGPAAAVELCLSGALEALAPGTGRLAPELTAPARESPAALFAELGAVPGWSIPGREIAGSRLPARVVVSAGTPPLVREASESLAGRLGAAELRRLDGQGPAHLDAPGELAGLLAEISPGA